MRGSLLALALLGPSLAMAQTLARRDSAGVRLLEIRLPAANAPARWRLDSASLSVGDGEDPSRELNAIKGAAILSDGSIIVVNGRPIELRRFGGKGQLLNRIGRQGSGPAEFRMIAGYQRLSSDTVLIFDRSLRRVSLVGWGDEPGVHAVAFAPVASSAYPMGLHSVIGRMNNGRYVAMGSAPGPSVSTGLATPRFRLVTLGSSLDSATVVGEFDSDDMFFVPARGGQAFGLPPFGRVTRVLVGGDGFYVARTAEMRIPFYDDAGRLSAILWSKREPRRLRQQDVERAADSAVRVSGGPRAGELTRASQYKTAPAFSDVALDGTGALWIREFSLDRRPTARWNVVDGRGVLQGSIDLPASARVMDAARESVLLLTRDENDVEHLELRRIRKGK